MNPLLEQFLSEARESLQSIAERLMQLENEPESTDLMIELFRLVHTLKGNSGLFDFPEMTRVLHAGEDLMDAVRSGVVAYSLPLADRLLDAMDFVGMLCDEIENNGCVDASHAGDSVRLAEVIRQLIGGTSESSSGEGAHLECSASMDDDAVTATMLLAPQLCRVAESVRVDAFLSVMKGSPLHLLRYTPPEDCFFQGDDPFFQVRQTPGIVWGGISHREPWPKLPELDAYRCLLDFHVLSTATIEELNEFYRYVPDQIVIAAVPSESLIIPQGDPNGGPVYDDFVTDALRLLHDGNRQGLSLAIQSMLELSNPDLWMHSALRWLQLVMDFEREDSGKVMETIIRSLLTLTPPEWEETEESREESTPLPLPDSASETKLAALQQTPVPNNIPTDAIATVVAAQCAILTLPDDVAWLVGRIKGVAAVLSGCLVVAGRNDALQELEMATESAVRLGTAAPLRDWLIRSFPTDSQQPLRQSMASLNGNGAPVVPAMQATGPNAPQPEPMPPQGEGEIKFGRRAEDSIVGSKVLKVDQSKIDRLMNLIGEMVVAKNALPYLAGRAEAVYGVRDLSREIKAQYAVINRIAEEMQDSIMQVRMMPVSFIFQRFPRLVRDISHRLGKEVHLLLEGEDTEADKHIIEALGDPLIHIVRNSLDHGIEQPEVRRAAGKPVIGNLTIRANQESDRVIIEIKDDGKGIDPEVIKRKAYEKGLIDEDRLGRISDQDAINLIFAAGFSTAEEVSDLSGRGVGMDVVRSAVEKINGSIQLESEKNIGTRLRISLPLSMAVTNVMIIKSNNQIFGVPMDAVVETVRVPRKEIRSIKTIQTAVLRGRIVPLKALNSLLGLNKAPQANAEDELAVLVVNHGEEPVGLLVDDFRETVDIILKPMTGVLAGLTAYSGSALLGDGSVLMVLNTKEIF